MNMQEIFLKNAGSILGDSAITSDEIIEPTKTAPTKST